MNREWMYRRFNSDGNISLEFHKGLESFIEFACGQPAFMDGDDITCPCRKCKNQAYKDLDTVRLHIASKGFEFNYHVWRYQGERPIANDRPNLVGCSNATSQQQMISPNPEKNCVFGVGSLYSAPSVNSRWESGPSETQLLQSDAALRAELEEIRPQVAASEKARHDLELLQDELDAEQERLMEMCEQQQRQLERLIQKRGTPPDM